MEGVTIENHDGVKAWRKDFTAWRFVQLGILGTFVCLFFAWYALSPALLFSNGYAVLKYYSGNMDMFSIMDESLNPIMLAMFIMNMIVLLRIMLMALLPIFTPRSERRLGKMFYGVPVIEYLAFIVLSIGLMVRIISLKLVVWLFPIFLLVFSIICLLAAVITMIVIYIKKYRKLNTAHHNAEAGTSINNIENGLQTNDKQLTIEALIWILDALFLIAAVVVVFI